MEFKQIEIIFFCVGHVGHVGHVGQRKISSNGNNNGNINNNKS